MKRILLVVIMLLSLITILVSVYEYAYNMGISDQKNEIIYSMGVHHVISGATFYLPEDIGSLDKILRSKHPLLIKNSMFLWKKRKVEGEVNEKIGMERIWELDGEVVPFTKIIKTAREYGYESPDGIYETSVAFDFLKRNGHKVKCTKK